MNDTLTDLIIKAHKQSFQRAFETAVRTGTSLVFMKKGKIVEVKPPYKYELVPIKKAKKKESKQRKKQPK